MSFQGFQAASQGGKVQTAYAVPDALLGMNIADALTFPFYLIGPSRVQALSETFLTCIPLGYEFLGYLLGDRPAASLKKVDLKPPDGWYLKLVSLTSTELAKEFDAILYPKKSPGLWVDLFLECLNLIGTYHVKEDLGQPPYEFPLDELEDWFDLWYTAVPKIGAARAGVDERHQLSDLFWLRVLPPKFKGPVKQLFKGIDLHRAVPEDEQQEGGSPLTPLLPKDSLAQMEVTPAHAYSAEWFNRLWSRLI